MRREPFILALCLLLAAVGGLSALSYAPAQAQTEPTATPRPPIAFQIVGEIGRALPKKFIYDPNFEQMAIVDAYSRLLLVDARDYTTRSVLHERGQYADIQFSQDRKSVV